MLATKRDLVAQKNYQYYLITNTRGDVIETRNGDGNVNAKFVYDAWGKLVSVTDANGNALSTDSFAYQISLKYRGYVYDNETGLYYLQSRYYDPETGRFINADDVEYIGYSGEQLSYNAFAYCENNAVCYVDVLGLVPTLLTIDSREQSAIKALDEFLEYFELKIVERGTLKRNKNYIFEIDIKYIETGGRHKGKILQINLIFGDKTAWFDSSQFDNCLNFSAQAQFDYTSDMINSPIESEDDYLDVSKCLQYALFFGIVLGAFIKQQHFKMRYNLMWGKNDIDPNDNYKYYLFDMDLEKYGKAVVGYSIINGEVVFLA